MNDYIRDRAKRVAKAFLENETTIREVADDFGVSKSTAHTDLTDRLKKIDHELFEEVKEQLEYNKMVRHIRGGEATKRYWKEKKASNA